MSNTHEPLLMQALIYTRNDELSTADSIVLQTSARISTLLTPQQGGFSFAIWMPGMCVNARLRSVSQQLESGSRCHLDKPEFEMPICEKELPLWVSAFDFGHFVAVQIPVRVNMRPFKTVHRVNLKPQQPSLPPPGGKEGEGGTLHMRPATREDSQPKPLTYHHIFIYRPGRKPPQLPGDFLPETLAA